jgi:succinate-semialdehyde dehydrogenase/glutarate-semialdehyde dehydrogenase
MASTLSINPYNQETIGEHAFHSRAEQDLMIDKASLAQRDWRKTNHADRAKLLVRLAGVLRERVEELSRMMTLEMGKPITQSRAEVTKCAWVCEHYAEVGPSSLLDQAINTDAHKSFIRFQPIGNVLAIMPWNFPYWQLFRVAAPNLMLGNALLLKHAPNVQGCAQLMIEVFQQAGFPVDLIANLHIPVEQVESVIAHENVHGVTLTGSTRAGRSVAALAGKYLKKTVLELGGSNAFVIMEDADLDTVLPIAYNARMQNTGQSCIAAKRFIVHHSLVNQFTEGMTELIRQNPITDPLIGSSTMGTLARTDLAEQLKAQLDATLSQGAICTIGGTQQEAHFTPTLVTGVTTEMTAFQEETFGPLAAVTSFTQDDEALEFIQSSSYGLGASICTSNPEKYLHWTNELQEGAVFYNELVKSDPRLPFGGVLNSGYGRELSTVGLHEFANIQTVYVR